MKTKNNKELNKIFLIMSIFAVATLAAGVEIGFNLRESLIKPTTVEKSNDTTKAIVAEDNTIYEALSPKLTIEKTESPVSMHYDLFNTSQAEVYVEKAIVKVYDKYDETMYSTEINLYKTFLPEESDRIAFQVPQMADYIARVEIEFE